MEMESKPCQDPAPNPGSLINGKRKKIKWGTQKTSFKKYLSKCFTRLNPHVAELVGLRVKLFPNFFIASHKDDC